MYKHATILNKYRLKINNKKYNYTLINPCTISINNTEYRIMSYYNPNETGYIPLTTLITNKYTLLKNSTNEYNDNEVINRIYIDKNNIVIKTENNEYRFTCIELRKLFVL